MIRIIFYILTVLLLLATLTACGILPLEAKGPANQKSTAPIETVKQPPQRKDNAKQKVRLLLDRQDYAEAILFISNDGRQVTAGALAKEYVEATNGGLEQADQLMNEGTFDHAAMLLKVIQENYPAASELQQQISETPEKIADKITFCTEKLMGTGLEAYRMGEFSTAIDVWEKVLAINPQHVAAKNSIQTTQVQLSNLKALNTKE